MQICMKDFEARFMDKLREARDSRTLSELADKASVDQGNISRALNQGQKLGLDKVSRILNVLGAIVVFPGDPVPGQSTDTENLMDKVRELEKQVDELREYKAKYEAARELVAIMSGNKPQPQQAPLPEPESKRKIA